METHPRHATRALPHIAKAIVAIAMIFCINGANAEERAPKVTPESSSAEEQGDAVEDAAKKADVERKLAAAKAAAQLEAMRRDLEATKQQLAERQMQLMETAKQMAKEERERALPPLENAELRIFALKTLPASSAANAIEDLFGPKALRFSIENQSNSLIVLGKQDSLQVIEALLTKLDQKEAHDDDKKPAQSANEQTSRSLLLRLFWLADGLPAGEGSDPSDGLPDSVLRAMKKLGLEKPRLVTQTVSSLAAGPHEATRFSADVPALIAGHDAFMRYAGKLTLTEVEKPALSIELSIGGKVFNCELEGSLSMPLGHFMVLGTANSLLPKLTTDNDPVGAMMGQAAGAPEAEFGPGGALVNPEAAAPEGGGMPGELRPAPKLNTSRFAFVVQVIEAESFAPEE